MVFNEITKKAVTHGIENPRQIEPLLVDAYMARRALDYLVGFNISPILWTKLPGSKSAGRVQSVAVRLVVDREREIKAFSPKEYWEVEINIRHEDRDITFKLNTKKSDLEINSKAEAEKLADELTKSEIEITSNEKSKRKIPVKPPFITSTLQQTSSSMLGFSLSKTMKLAQDLYTGGYISYMRTDSPNISILAQNNCKTIIIR